MKKCPFCAEEVQGEAIKCKHCGEFLEQGKQTMVVDQKELDKTKRINASDSYKEGAITSAPEGSLQYSTPILLLAIVLQLSFPLCLIGWWFFRGEQKRNIAYWEETGSRFKHSKLVLSH